MQLSNSNNTLPLPHIFQLELLFKHRPELSLNIRKIPFRDTVGFPRGSTIMLTGQPGAGKSFFALSLIREQIYAIVRKSPSTEIQAELIYIGVGFDRDFLEHRYRAFGWFDEFDKINFNVTAISVDETVLPLPTKGTEDLLNLIISKLRNHLKSPTVPPNVFVVIDTLGKLVKGSLSAGDRQRSIEELLSRIRASVGVDRKALCVLIDDTP